MVRIKKLMVEKCPLENKKKPKITAIKLNIFPKRTNVSKKCLKGANFHHLVTLPKTQPALFCRKFLAWAGSSRSGCWSTSLTLHRTVSSSTPPICTTPIRLTRTEPSWRAYWPSSSLWRSTSSSGKFCRKLMRCLNLIATVITTATWCICTLYLFLIRANPGLFFVYFTFSHQVESNSDRTDPSRPLYPLDHHHGPIPLNTFLNISHI